jgi:hypothetical protein
MAYDFLALELAEISCRCTGLAHSSRSTLILPFGSSVARFTSSMLSTSIRRNSESRTSSLSRSRAKFFLWILPCSSRVVGGSSDFLDQFALKTSPSVNQVPYRNDRYRSNSLYDSDITIDDLVHYIPQHSCYDQIKGGDVSHLRFPRVRTTSRRKK